MSDLNKIYKNLRTKNPNMDDRSLKQQAWVLRDKLIFEKTTVVSSSAASAGAGSGGGNSQKNNIDLSTNNYIVNDYVDDYFE